MTSFATRSWQQDQEFSLEDNDAVRNWISKLQFPHDCNPSVFHTIHGTTIGPIPIYNLGSPCSAGLLDGLLILREASRVNDIPQGLPASNAEANASNDHLSPASSSSSPFSSDKDPPGTSTGAAYDFRRFLPEGYRSDAENIRSSVPPPQSPPQCDVSCNCACHQLDHNPTIIITAALATPLSLPQTTVAKSRAPSAPPSLASPPQVQANPKILISADPFQPDLGSPPRQHVQSNSKTELSPDLPPLPPLTRNLPPDDPPFAPSLTSTHPLCPLELAAWIRAIRSLDSGSRSPSRTSEGSQEYTPSYSSFSSKSKSESEADSKSESESDSYSPPSPSPPRNSGDGSGDGHGSGEEDNDDYDPAVAFTFTSTSKSHHTNDNTNSTTNADAKSSKKKNKSHVFPHSDAEPASNSASDEDDYDPEVAFTVQQRRLEREKKRREREDKKRLQRAWERMLEEEVGERGVEVEVEGGTHGYGVGVGVGVGEREGGGEEWTGG